MEQSDLRSNYSEHPIRLILDVTSSGNLTLESTLSLAKEQSREYCWTFLVSLNILDEDIFDTLNVPYVEKTTENGTFILLNMLDILIM